MSSAADTLWTLDELNFAQREHHRLRIVAPGLSGKITSVRWAYIYVLLASSLWRIFDGTSVRAVIVSGFGLTTLLKLLTWRMM